MRKCIGLLLCVLLTFTIFACSNDESGLVNKWQLRHYQYADGTIQKEDSVFYNFMKGSFSAICISPSGAHFDYFGNYSFDGNKLSIKLLPETVIDSNFKRYMNWEDLKREFTVNELSSSVLQLSYKDVKIFFRKY